MILATRRNMPRGQEIRVSPRTEPESGQHRVQPIDTEIILSCVKQSRTDTPC
jgi:hypothetical protein